MTWLTYLDGALVQIVAKVAPWLAPLPTAWLVFDRTQRHLGWPWWVGLIAGLTLEALGVAILATTLELYSYNRRKRKSDPRAPLMLGLALVALYFLAAELLTVVLDIAPTWTAPLAAAVFPVLSVAAFAVLAIRADHDQRVTEIAHAKADAKAERARKKAERDERQMEQRESQVEEKEAELEPPGTMTKAERVIWLHEREPLVPREQLAVAIGCSMTTVNRALASMNERMTTKQTKEIES